MLSYPSSFKSSRVSDKQNINPNYIRNISARSTPFSKQQSRSKENQRAKHRLVQNSSEKQEKESDQNKQYQFLSVYNTINIGNQARNKKMQSSNNSVKTLLNRLNGFCSTIEQTQQTIQSQTFRALLTKIFNNQKQLSRKQLIQLCLKNNLTNKQDILFKVQGKQNQRSFIKNNHNMKQLLSSDLGELIIEELCQCLDRGGNLTEQQEQVIQYLIPHSCASSQDEITSHMIRQYYEILREQLQSEELERKKLTKQFNSIHKHKIQTRLWSDHFKLQISKQLNFRQDKTRISYQSLCKCLGPYLTQSQISVVFRYIYILETNLIMPILDVSKSISKKILVANLFRKGQQQIREANLQQKNLYYQLEQSHKKIDQISQQNQQYVQILGNKDKQIDRLNRIIDLMQIQKQENEKIYRNQMQIQIQSCRNKYQKRIQDLMNSNKQQLRLTQWYQRQLQVIMQAVNKQNIMHKFLQ